MHARSDSSDSQRPLTWSAFVPLFLYAVRRHQLPVRYNLLSYEAAIILSSNVTATRSTQVFTPGASAASNLIALQSKTLLVPSALRRERQRELNSPTFKVRTATPPDLLWGLLLRLLAFKHSSLSRSKHLVPSPNAQSEKRPTKHSYLCSQLHYRNAWRLSRSRAPAFPGNLFRSLVSSFDEMITDLTRGHRSVPLSHL